MMILIMVLVDMCYWLPIKFKLILQRFAAFMAPLTFGRVNIAATAVYISKVPCTCLLCISTR